MAINNKMVTYNFNAVLYSLFNNNIPEKLTKVINFVRYKHSVHNVGNGLKSNQLKC